ncbi:MAG: hypothetical protein JST29_01430 [Bacteroidetes bacterium]|nr:hypothetical protein [Bacteroidota bacterium]
MKKIFGFGIIAITVIVISCKTKDNKTFTPQFTISKTQQYHYLVNNKTNTTVNNNGKETTIQKELIIGFLYTKSNTDSIGNHTIITTCDSFKVYTNTNDKETEYNASNPYAFSPIEKLITAIKGSSSTYTVDKNNKIIKSTNSLNHLQDSLLALLPAIANKQQLQQQIQSVFNSNLLKNSLEDATTILPNKPICQGEEWEKKQPSQELKIDFTTHYTLEKITDTNLVIKAKATANDIDISALLPGINSQLVTTDLKIKSAIEIILDKQTGLPLKNKNTTTITGTINSKGKELPVTITMEKELIGKKL